MDDHIASDFVRGKQVTIIGFQKSALDIAMECQEVNGVLLILLFNQGLFLKLTNTFVVFSE